MNWQSLAVWLNLDEEPDLPKLARYQVSTVYLDPRSGNAANVVHACPPGVQMGIYEATSWYGNLTPESFATIASADVQRLIPQAGVHPVMLDVEDVPGSFVAAFLAAWRKLRPVRETAFTFEPFKVGAVYPVAPMINAHAHVYPQCYHGDMSPVDPAAVVLDAVRWGMPASTVHAFYDGARAPAPYAKDGAYFTQGRLP